MPDEHTNPAEIDPAPSPGEPAGEMANPGDESIGASAPQRAKSASPLVTAVEIENFKGIGRPVRIDLRPITLLFGRNSAGKSTVLHALCYAHEILSHRNVNARKTELGGEQIDLGGFHNFVHAHDPTRTVRLRLELNLEGWEVPRPLHERLQAQYYDEHEMEVDVDSTVGALAQKATSGWVELRAQLSGEQPVLASYEVGVNEARVGRVHAHHQVGLALELNPAHPLLESALRPPPPDPRPPALPHFDKNSIFEAAKSDTHADRVREAAGSTIDSGQISRMAVRGLASPVPHWGELFFFDDRKLPLSVAREELQARVSALLVGIGHVLRDELANLRYIGPIRDLHPQTGVESRMSAPACWANGSAAWTYLHSSPGRDLIDDVSNWLKQPERFDTGYKLHARSILEVRGDVQLLSLLREYHHLRKTFGNAAGGVNIDQWAHKKAEDIVGDIAQERTRVTQIYHQIRERLATVAGVDELGEKACREAGEGIELVDQYVRELGDISIELIEAQIKLPGNEKIHRPLESAPEDDRRLAELVARMTVREERIEEARELKARSDAAEKIRSEFTARVEDPDEKERQVAKGVIAKINAILRTIDERIERIPDHVTDFYIEKIRAQIEVSGIDEFHASVELARDNWHRLAALVTKVENRDFTSKEMNELAAATAARPLQRELQLVTAGSDLPVRTSDIGVGVSQILPVVVAALDPNRPGITAIEQPELHVHPKIQVELGDLFAQRIDRGGVFLIETHSEHLMLRLLRRIEETHGEELPEGKPPLKPDEVSVVFMEKVGSEVRAARLRIDETGEFKDRWPHGFFDERVDELF